MKHLNRAMPAVYAVMLASWWLILCAVVVSFPVSEAAAQGQFAGVINGTSPPNVVTSPLGTDGSTLFPAPMTVVVPPGPSGIISGGGTTLTVNNTANGSDTVLSADGGTGGSSNPVNGATLRVADPGLTFVNSACCGMLPAAVVTAYRGGHIDLGDGTTASSQGASATLNNIVLLALNDFPPSLQAASQIIGTNVRVDAIDGDAFGVLSFNSNPGNVAAMPIIMLSGLNLNVRSTNAAAEALVVLNGGMISILPAPNGGESNLTVDGTAAATGVDVIGTGGTIKTINLNLGGGTMNVIGPPDDRTVAINLFSNAGVVNIQNAFVNSSGFGIDAGVGTSTVTFDNVTMTNGSGVFLRVGAQGSNGTLNFTATDESHLSGEADTFPGATSNVTLNDGSVWTGEARTMPGSTSNVTLDNGSVWTITGDSNLTNLTNDASTIEFAAPTGDAEDPASYKTLTVDPYSGNDGTLVLNTFLGEDDSPSDRLVVTSTASGSTGVIIHNTGGPGRMTTGDGIPVIQTGASDDGAFTLVGEARAGVFDYFLVTPDQHDWFLQSGFIPNPEPPGPLGPNGEEEELGPNGEELVIGEELPGPDGDKLIVGPDGLELFLPGGGLPVDPPLGELPPGVEFPIIGPEIATYATVQPLARQMGLAMLGTLHQRIGDTLTLENADPFAQGWGRSGWARFFGQQVDNHYLSFGDPSTSGQLFGVQAGFDILRASFIPGHRDAAGVYFAYSNGNMDVDGLVTNPELTAYVHAHTGTVNLMGYSAGVYWTHYGPGGWYLDAVAQGTIYDGNARTQFANLPTTGTGFIASLEAGYPIPLPIPLGQHFVLEPQGQILWQRVSFRSANDGEGPVALGSTSGVTGRLGLRAQTSFVSRSGQVWQPYVRANLWQNWGGRANTEFAGEGVPLLEGSTQLELGAGVTYKFSALLSVYAQASYQFAVGGDTDGRRRQGVGGDIGLRLTFGQPAPALPPVPVATPAPAAARSYLVFFDWDQATLTGRARQIIREAAVSSTRVRYTRIEVNGHTDTTGTPSYNQGLSIRRAQAVAGELVRDGVPERAISIRGYGQTNLLIPTGPGVREPQNRRVEIILR